MYIENDKTFLDEVKENINKWKDILCSWSGRFKYYEGDCSPKKSTESKQCYKNSKDFCGFYRKGKTDPQIHMEFQGVPSSQNKIKKKKKSEASHIYNFKAYYKTIVIKTA